MSCHICDDAHIRALTDAAIYLSTDGGRILPTREALPHLPAEAFDRNDRLRADWKTAEAEVFALLYRANERSVNERYAESHDFVPDMPRREIPGVTRRLAPRLLRAIDCYAYQSCYSQAWAHGDAAYDLIDQLRRSVCRFVEGYSDAAWGW